MLAFIRSSVGKKILVALSGLVLFGFIVGHLIGNLQIFTGPEKINLYARFLHAADELLWGTRAILLMCLITHIVFTVQLHFRNMASRPIPYGTQDTIDADWPSRLMIWSGIFLGLYIPYHILHLSLGGTHPNFQELNVYANVIRGFQVWPVALIYVAAMVALGFHLYHAVFSVFQTLGINNPQINKYRRPLAVISAVLISGGYISIPVSVWLGILK